MKKHFYIILGLILLVLGTIVFHLPIKAIKGSRIGGLDINSIRPASFVEGKQYSKFLQKNELTKDAFEIYIAARDLSNSNDNKITLKESEFPFYGETEVSLNVSYDRGHNVEIPAKVISATIERSSTKIWEGQEPTDIYTLKVTIPQELKSDEWQAIQDGAFSVSKKSSGDKKLIPESFILNDLKDPSKNYVCVIDKKEEAFSIDYQYYWVKGHLQPVTIKEKTTYKDIVDRGNYIDIDGVSSDDELAVPLHVSSCVKNPEKYSNQKFLNEYTELENKVNGLTKVTGITEEGYLVTEKSDYKFAMPVSYDNAKIFKDFATNYLLGQEVRVELQGPDDYRSGYDSQVLVANIFFGDDLVNDKYKRDWRESADDPRTPYADLKYYKNVAQILQIYNVITTESPRIVINTTEIFPNNDPTQKAVAPRTMVGNHFPTLINGKNAEIVINNNADNKDPVLGERYASFLQKNWQKWDHELVIDFSNKEEFVRSYQCFNGYDCISQKIQIFRAPVSLGGVLLNEMFK